MYAVSSVHFTFSGIRSSVSGIQNKIFEVVFDLLTYMIYHYHKCVKNMTN